MVAMPCTLLLRMDAWKQWNTSFPNLVKRCLTGITMAAHVWTWPFNNRSKMLWTGFFRRVGLPPIGSRWAPSNLQYWSVPLPHPTNVCTPHCVRHRLTPDELSHKKLVVAGHVDCIGNGVSFVQAPPPLLPFAHHCSICTTSSFLCCHSPNVHS